MVSACHLLFPQLENSLRHVLSDAGIDTSKLDEEMLQEDRSLSGLLSNRREQLESVFGLDLIYTNDLLFNFKGGPCLRHEIAHGKLAPGACYLHSSIYACWLMYCLCCHCFTFTLCPVTVNPVAGCQNLNCSRRIAP
jgi:hypothetical protein